MKNTSQNSTIPPASACQLESWGLIFVEGPDAANFLQNQLTNSILGMDRTLTPHLAKTGSAARLVGYCNPKGRLIASAWTGLYAVSETGDDRFALFISKDISSSIAKRLSMYVLRSKVKVVDVSADWTVSGLYGAHSDLENYELEPGEIGLRLPDVLLDQGVYGRALTAKPNTIQSKANVSALKVRNYLEVMSAIPRIVLATQEQFVPQMINFESVAGIDFKKGCYPGQEIVARSQYRGAIKRRLQLAHFIDQSNGEQSIAPGAELFHGSDASQPAGMVVLSAQSPHEEHRIDLQIECKLEALENGEIHLGNIAGPVLKIDSLPYPLIEI